MFKSHSWMQSRVSEHSGLPLLLLLISPLLFFLAAAVSDWSTWSVIIMSLDAELQSWNERWMVSSDQQVETAGRLYCLGSFLLIVLCCAVFIVALVVDFIASWIWTEEVDRREWTAETAEWATETSCQQQTRTLTQPDLLQIRLTWFHFCVCDCM